jgi:hypothetical protein
MHSGWGALVAVCDDGGTVAVLERRRMAVTTPGTAGANQPYHFAKRLEFAEAEKFLEKCCATSKRLAVAAIREVVEQLSARQYRVAASGMLLASGRAMPPLAKILASHALIHAAEGDFFREAFSKACADMELRVTGVRERDLEEHLRTTFGKAAGRMQRQVSNLGRSVGPPWTTDQKTATLAALLALGKK